MSSRLKEIAEKKGDILSKILKVDLKSLREAKAVTTASAASVAKAATRSKRSQSSSSGMDTRVIANIQNRINNPLFSLTISDYELMCSNKMITKMMSKVLECDEKQLKKFCKYINVFKENIKSSPKSIKNKMKPDTKMTLNKLPEELITQIVQKYMTLFPTKYELRDWIPLEKLDWGNLSKNPNDGAIELLKKHKKKIDWLWLSSNPNPEAIELLKANPKNINWDFLSYNKGAIELLKAKPEKINWDMLSGNSNPIAVQLLKENPDEIHWGNLSRNQSAIKLLEKRINENNEIDNDDSEDDFNPFDNIDKEKLSANPNAIRLLKANPKIINWEGLSENPYAIELLKENQGKIDWRGLSTNPNAIELLKANPNNIDWMYLSANPNDEALELLKENQDKINWKEFSANPAIFEAK